MATTVLNWGGATGGAGGGEITKYAAVANYPYAESKAYAPRRAHVSNIDGLTITGNTGSTYGSNTWHTLKPTRNMTLQVLFQDAGSNANQNVATVGVGTQLDSAGKVKDAVTFVTWTRIEKLTAAGPNLPTFVPNLVLEANKFYLISWNLSGAAVFVEV